MHKTYCLLVLAFLGACASTAAAPKSKRNGPTFTGMLPSTPIDPEKDGVPTETTLPVGVGLTTGPSSLLLGATLDFAIDKKLTFGPSLQVGIDSNVRLTTLTGQFKYFLPINEGDSFTFLPYLTGGVGAASIDKDGSSSDSGALFNIGAGLRYLTGDHYRVGSEARLNILPDKLAGESTFLSFSLLEIVINF